MGQIILHMELEHCCPELIMTRATHWQVTSQISLGKVQSLHFSNKKSSQHPYRHMEAYIDENISSITDQYLASSGAVSSHWRTAAQNRTPELHPCAVGATPRTRSAAASHSGWQSKRHDATVSLVIHKTANRWRACPVFVILTRRSTGSCSTRRRSCPTARRG